MQVVVVERSRATEDDPALVERFRRGDATAFDLLMTRHRQAVYAVARRLLGSHEDADEAAQLALMRAWRSRESFRGDSALSTWLTRIVLNVGKSMIVARRSQIDPLPAAPEPRGRDEGAERAIGRVHAGVRVRRAVAALPPRQRDVVLLKVFSELTHREVANVLGLSEGAVKAHLHQAIANLRRLMATEQAREMPR